MIDNIPEIRAAPPALEEVVRELDRDTKHIGRPTRSPRRPTWKADSFHFPSDARKWLEPHERAALLEACQQVDPGGVGRIPVAAIRNIMQTIGAENLASRAERTLPRERTPDRFEEGEQTVAFSSLVDLLAESFRLVRQPFGGKRCIVSRLPLPPCCENGYCMAHLERPASAMLQGAPDDNLKRAALKIVFTQHDADGSGALEMEELPKILAEFGVEYDENRLQDMFNIYDVDRSGALDFEEFSALLADMNADRAVAEKKMLAYHLPASLLKEFSPEAVEEMRVTFGLFDESGDGALDEEELGDLLRTFGQEPTKEKIHKEMLEIDYDRSGTIEFQEFVMLMKKIRDGDVELDDSAFARAVMNSAVASRLSEELRRLEAQSIPCVGASKLVNSAPATLEVKIAGPSGTPYEGCKLTLQVVASDGYPFMAPVAKFLERVFHLNFSVLLDGTTAVRPVLDQWTAGWDVARLLRELIQLLREPDPSLLPDNITRGRRVAPGDVLPVAAFDMHACHGDTKAEEQDQPGSAVAKKEERGTGVDRGMEGRERAREKEVKEGQRDHDKYKKEEEGCLIKTKAEGEAEEAETGIRQEQSQDCFSLGKSGGTHGDGEGDVAFADRAGSSEGRNGVVEGKRVVRGDDLREQKWGNLMSARIASLWYDNLPLYEETARRIAAPQGQ